MSRPLSLFLSFFLSRGLEGVREGDALGASMMASILLSSFFCCATRDLSVKVAGSWMDA